MLAPEARHDLADILVYSERLWGGRQRGVSESLTYSSPVTAVLVAVRFVQILLPHGLIR